MASFKEDQRKDLHMESALQNALAKLNNEVEVDNDPSHIRQNGAQLDSIPPYLLGLPVSYIKVPMELFLGTAKEVFD